MGNILLDLPPKAARTLIVDAPAACRASLVVTGRPLKLLSQPSAR
jgi:hypothetical protein